MKKIVILLMLSLPVLVYAQKKELTPKQKKRLEERERVKRLLAKEEEGALVYNKQGAFGIKLNTDGYGIFYEHGKYKTITLTNLWWAELGEHKHAKEERLAKGDNYGFIIGNPYIYGKINNFYNFKLGFGQQRLIGGKGIRNGIATSLIYGGGVSLAMLKPYYLEVKDPLTSEVKNIRYDDDTTLFLDNNSILGASGFGKGFNKMSFVPGLHARAALRFDYGRLNETLSALEIGVNAEYYTKGITQMAFNKDKKFFFNAYIALVFGSRK